MTIFVNNKPVEILPGMTVRHALISAGLLKKMKSAKKVCKVFDEWGNEVGLDGALSEGVRIYFK